MPPDAELGILTPYDLRILSGIPATERPRERCLREGARCLSLRECLALLLNTGPRGMGCLGLAQGVLGRPGTGLDEAAQERAYYRAMEVSPEAYLEGMEGLGPASRARLLAAFELGRRYATFRERESRAGSAPPPRGPVIAAQALRAVPPDLRGASQEWLGFVPVFSSGRSGSLCLVERGVRTHVNVEPGELFARILALRPASIVLFHNHPSGNLTPSEPDLELTRRVAKMGHQLGVRVLGHWVVASGGETWIEGQEMD